MKAPEILQKLSHGSRAFYCFVHDVGLVKFISGVRKQEMLRDDWIQLEKLIKDENE